MENKKSSLENYLDTLSFMLDGASEAAFVYSIEDKRIYFTDEIDKKFNLIPMTDFSYTEEEMRKILKSDNDAVMFDFSVMTDPKRVYVRDYRLVRCDGGEMMIRCHIKVRFDDMGKRIMLMGKFSDASNIHDYDPRTGLANSRRMVDDIKVCIKRGLNGHLMVLGIDNLKSINSRYGRNYGNQIMLFVAQVLTDLSAEKIKVYGLDGDKFALLAEDAESTDEIERLYEYISEKISAKCTVSAGVVSLCDNVNDAELIYQRAENAMDQAKQNGKSTYEFFTEEIYQRQLKAYNLSEELRKSVSENFDGFYLNFQPQISGKTFEITGVEALLRYTSLTRGFVPPDEFIPILEQSGLIIDIGSWVLKNSLRQCAMWRRFLPELRVSVNVSYVQLMEDDFTDMVLSELNDAGLSGDSLTLELTESVQLQDFQSYNNAFRKLEIKGIDISIDDFGTGYSSLNYLKSIDADEVKIDRCFIMNIQHSAYNYRLLSNTVDLAHSVEIRVCCEGVETEDELLTILQVHPDMLQGYLFSKPLSIEAFENTYINTDSEEYKLVQSKKEHFCALEHRYNTENQQIAEKDTLSAIVDGMEEIVYVCSDEDEYELLYMNAAGREKTGVYDYRGKKCYEVVMNRQSPCENCRNRCQNNGEYKSWERYNEHLNCYYLHKEKKIQWHGQDARLTISIDVTEKEKLTSEIQDKFEFERNIVSCSKMLSEETDRNIAINNLLISIGEFYESDRAYLFEKVENSDKWTNTFEWCACGVAPQIDLLQEVKMSATDRWEDVFRKGESIVIDNIEDLKDVNYDEWEILSSQGIKSLIVAPVWENGNLIGFIGVDDPKKHTCNYSHISTIACFLADRLLRDNTDAEHEYMRQKEFYKALLSETVAYAEIDMESQHIISLGGLWIDYADEKSIQENDFFQIFSNKVEEHIYCEDRQMALEFYKEIVKTNKSAEFKSDDSIVIRRNIDGETHWVMLTCHIFKEDVFQKNYALIYIKDIDMQKKRELANELAATRDSLTGLYNRSAFEAEVTGHMAKDPANCGTLLLIDLDDFKGINDRLGHVEGDKALRQMANILLTTFRRKDIIGRIGGDEFLIFMKNVSDRNIIHERLTEFRTALNNASNGELRCSIGVTYIPHDDFNYGKCLENVDKALYRSKFLGKNTYSYYD